jgi:hypothetical protein
MKKIKKDYRCLSVTMSAAEMFAVILRVLCQWRGGVNWEFENKEKVLEEEQKKKKEKETTKGYAYYA